LRKTAAPYFGVISGSFAALNSALRKIRLITVYQSARNSIFKEKNTKKAVHYTPPAENRINKTLYDNMVLEISMYIKGLI